MGGVGWQCAVCRYYKARFQIEFLFRDAGYHVGLTHWQGRSEKKLHFYFNASLTIANIAKTAQYLSEKTENSGYISLTDITTSYFNK